MNQQKHRSRAATDHVHSSTKKCCTGSGKASSVPRLQERNSPTTLVDDFHDPSLVFSSPVFTPRPSEFCLNTNFFFMSHDFPATNTKNAKKKKRNATTFTSETWERPPGNCLILTERSTPPLSRDLNPVFITSSAGGMCGFIYFVFLKIQTQKTWHYCRKKQEKNLEFAVYHACVPISQQTLR